MERFDERFLEHDAHTRAPARRDLLGERELDQALRDLRALASDRMAGRETGSAGGERARARILGELHRLRVEPMAGSHEHPFFWTQADGVHRHGANVLAMIPGTQAPERIVVLSAHYDHLGDGGGERVFNGADDNASGVAAVLAVARLLMRHPPSCSVLLAFFDGEEAELRGSTHFVMHPPLPLEQVVLQVNVDMVGRSSDWDLWAVGTRHHPALRAPIEWSTRHAPVRVRFGHDRLGWIPFLDHDWTQLSDQGAFHDAGIPWIYFGTKSDPETHSSHDDAGSVDEEFFLGALETIARAFGGLDLAMSATTV